MADIAGQRRSVQTVIAQCQLDHQRGTVFLVDQSGHRADFSTLSDLQRAIENIAEVETPGEPGWDGDGRYMDNTGAWAYPPSPVVVGEELRRSPIAAFFTSQELSERREPILTIPVSEPVQKAISIEFDEISAELIAYLAKHPERMYELNPYKFEDLVAAIMRDRGYEVIQTPKTRDGGRDLLAVQKGPFGTLLTLVECKRYARHQRVGPEPVRALMGVVGMEHASHGVLATTTTFTPEARRIETDFKYRLSLRDYNDLVAWCRDFGAGKGRLQ
jgi:hypothetical protein